MWCERTLGTQEYNLTAASVVPGSSIIKTPSVVILTPSRDDTRLVQPSGTETSTVKDLKCFSAHSKVYHSSTRSSTFSVLCAVCIRWTSTLFFVFVIIFTLEPPQLQHHRAALQVVEQALAGVQGGKVYSVIQHRIDIVPHSWTEQIATAVKQPKPEGREERDATTKKV